MVDIPSRGRGGISSGTTEGSCDVDEIHHAGTRPKLDQSEILEATLLVKAENLTVEAQRGIDVPSAHHHVVQGPDADRSVVRRPTPHPTTTEIVIGH